MMSLILQNSFLTKCITVCNNLIISSYLDLSFTGFIAHCYFLYMTSFPICIFWSNFHLTGLLPLVMVSEMQSVSWSFPSPHLFKLSFILYRRGNSAERISNLPKIIQNIKGGARVLWELKLIHFGEPSLKRSTKLGKKVNIYLEWEKESKQIHHTIQKNSRFFTNCCTHV